MPETTLKIAVQGCCHGELTKIYKQLQQLPEADQPELLIVCGDFQSLRSPSDFPSLNVPDKYKKLGDFHDYYTGKLKVPILTIFIGGNHEASDFLLELPYGGWVCENVYYMGFSNVIWYKGLKIGGISGIFKYFDFYKPHYEKIPLNGTDVRSCYHTRFEDQLKLLLYPDLNLNCLVSHDWPVSVTDYGDVQRLLRVKPYFKDDINRDQLGSKFHWDLLTKLKPNYWFAAHLHVKFDAVVKHEESLTASKRKLSTAGEAGPIDIKKVCKNSEEIDLDLDESEPTEESNNDNKDKLELDTNERPKDSAINEDEVSLSLSDDEKSTSTFLPASSSPSSPSFTGFSQTNFLALDKCTRRNENLQIMGIPLTNPQHPSASSENDNHLYYDEEFIKINKFMNTFKTTEFFKTLRWENVLDDDKLIGNLRHEIKEEKLRAFESLIVPLNFEPTLENPKVQTDLYADKFMK